MSCTSVVSAYLAHCIGSITEPRVSCTQKKVQHPSSAVSGLLNAVGIGQGLCSDVSEYFGGDHQRSPSRRLRGAGVIYHGYRDRLTATLRGSALPHC